MSPRSRPWVTVYLLVALLLDATIVSGVAARYQSLRRSARPTIGSAGAHADPALPRLGDLTIGGRAGTDAVGLTVRPGLPGRNVLLVYVEPLGGDAGRLSVGLSVDGRPLPVRTCSPWCRRSEATLSGAASIRVHVSGKGGGTARFQIPSLPAPDGLALFNLLEQRMHSLRTYQQQEAFDNGSSIVRSTYGFESPDRLRVTEPNGFAVVWIGSTRYQRQGRGRGWIEQPGQAMSTLPSFIWDYIPDQRFDFRVIGKEGLNTGSGALLSFYGPEGGSAPYWFTLWVDRTGIVRRAEMVSAGHFMTETFNRFNASLTITPPRGAIG